MARSLAAVAVNGTVALGGHVPFRQRVALPVLDKFAQLGARLSPGGARAKLTQQLDLAGNPPPWTVERILSVKAAALLVSSLVSVLLFLDGGLLRAVLVAAPVAAVSFYVPDLLLRNAGQKRQLQIQKTLPDALELLTITVEAGMGFDAALSQAAQNTKGPLSGEFFRVLQEMQMKSRLDAFRALGERTTVAELRAFISALVQADKLGIPLGRVLREQAKEMRLKRRQRAEEQAMKVPVKILFPMMVFILPVLFVIVLAPSLMEIGKAMSGS